MEGLGSAGTGSMGESGSGSSVSRSAGSWSPRGRIRPKDTRRECARDLTVPAMDFGLESTLSMVGRALRGRCSLRAEKVGEADLARGEGGG